ncbi:MAG: lycopene cyclase domain-containing protein [Candidatus Omnitrophota bacterium]|jgi:lycopene cyclase domain-containing protein
MSEYLKVLLISLSVPLFLSFYSPLKIWPNLKALAATLGLIILVFGGWDVFAAYRRHWHFDFQQVYGLRLLNLPLEEVLFFIIIPFCCIFTWEAIIFLKGKIK